MVIVLWKSLYHSQRPESWPVARRLLHRRYRRQHRSRSCYRTHGPNRARGDAAVVRYGAPAAERAGIDAAAHDAGRSPAVGAVRLRHPFRSQRTVGGSCWSAGGGQARSLVELAENQNGLKGRLTLYRLIGLFVIRDRSSSTLYSAGTWKSE